MIASNFRQNCIQYPLRNLTPHVDIIFEDHKTGIQYHTSIADQIFCIRQRLEVKWKYNETDISYLQISRNPTI
jgi:hypothetical protein